MKESGIDVTRPDAQTATKQNRVVFLSQSMNTMRFGLIAVRSTLMPFVPTLNVCMPRTLRGVLLFRQIKMLKRTLVEVMDQIRLAGVQAISIAAEER